MRALLLIAATLAVGACNGGKSDGNSVTAAGNSSEQVISTNDITAIDAATGESVNMAADVNYTFEANEMTANSTSNSTGRPRPAAKPATAAPAPAEEAATANEG
jgi:hypothetical protein